MEAKNRWARGVRRRGPAGLARASRRCTPPARSPRTSRWRHPGLDTLDILVLWKGFPTYASTQTIFTILKADWFYLRAERVRAVGSTSALRRRRPRPARARAGGAVGRHRAPGLVQGRPAGRQRQGRRRRVRTRGHGGRGRDRRRCSRSRSSRCRRSSRRPRWPRSPGPCRPACRRGRTRGSTPRSTRCTPPARSAGRTASSTATQQLQADRSAAGLRGVLAAAAAAAAGRVRLGLPGVRAPRAARRAAQLRPGDGARSSPCTS